jgi:hypothetical protein
MEDLGGTLGATLGATLVHAMLEECLFWIAMLPLADSLRSHRAGRRCKKQLQHRP